MQQIRCDLSTGKTSCTNCSLYNTECLPRLRKRKRTTSSAVSENNNDQCSRRYSVHSDPVQLSPALSPAPCEVLDAPSFDESSHIDVLLVASAGDGHLRNHPAASSEGTQATPTASGPVSGNSADEAISKVSPTGEAHDGKAVYFGPMEGRVVESTNAYPQTSGLSPADLASLQRSGAFELPSRALKACYIDNFFKHCYPWVPVVEEAWLRETPTQKPSLLLMQAVLLAGSRVTTPNDVSASGEIYRRAKALFFSNYEQNPVIRIVACLLLRWWNPAGPDRVCMDSSHFWIGTGVGIAISIGLHTESSNSRDVSYRRTLWWSLLAHDSQISAVHGRPGSIHVEDYNILPLTVRDFSRDAQDRASSSIAYISISWILGDVGQSYRRNQMTATRIENHQNALYAWIRELPDKLRLFHSQVELGPKAYHFEGRQLHVTFFVNLILIFRQPTIGSSESVSAGSLLAASFVAGLYEEFLVRDEIKHLGPAIHKFFLMAAGITLLSARRHPLLATAALGDFNTIIKALKQFSTRYPSAMGTIRTLENLETSQSRAPDYPGCISPPQPNVRALFREFGPDLCKQWHLMDIASPSIHGPDVTSDPPPTTNRFQDSVTGAELTQIPREQGGTSTDELAGMRDSYDLSIPDLDSLWPCYWPDMPSPTGWILKDTPFDLEGASTVP